MGTSEKGSQKVVLFLAFTNADALAMFNVFSFYPEEDNLEISAEHDYWNPN